MSAAKTPWHRTLSIGMSGADVRALQRLVGAKVDGKFGPKTKEAVKRWQKKATVAGKKPLVVDGVFGAKSQKRSQELKSSQPAKSSSSGSGTKPAAPAKTTKRRRKRKPRAADMPRSQKKTQKTTKTRTADCPLKAAKPKNARRSKKPKDPKKDKLKPCGYKVLKVACQHTKGQKNGRKIVEQFPHPKYTSRTLEVVAGHQAGRGDKIAFEMASSCGFCNAAPDGHAHPSFQVFDSTTKNKKLLKTVNKQRIEFEVKSLALDSLAKSTGKRFISLITRYYFPRRAVGKYLFVAHACGRPQTSTDRVYGSRALVVNAYPNERYKFELELAPGVQKNEVTHRGQKSMPLRGGGRATVSQATVTRNIGAKKGEFSAAIAKSKDKVQLGASVEKVDSNSAKELLKGFKFERIEPGATKGTDLSYGYGGLADVIGFYDQVFGTLNRFQRLLGQFPKCGWYIDYQMSLLQGKFELEWGYKEEPKSWKVYKNIKATTKFTLVKAVAEFGFGVVIAKGVKLLEVAVYAAVSGELYMQGSVETQPSEELEGKIVLGGEIKGEVGLKATAAGSFVKASAKLTTGFVLEGGVKATTKTPPHFVAELTWSGVEGEVSIAVAWGIYKFTKKRRFRPKAVLLQHPKSKTAPTKKDKFKETAKSHYQAALEAKNEALRKAGSPDVEGADGRRGGVRNLPF